MTTEIVFDVPVQCLVTVTLEAGEVTKVVLLPREGDAGYFGCGSTVYEGPEELMDRGLEILNGTVWPPLLELPDSVNWEG